MNVTNKILFLLIFAFVQIGCDSALTPDQYMQFTEKNRKKFSLAVERNGVKATIAYQPIEYYAAREMQFDTTLSLDSAINRYEKSVFFVLVIEAKKVKTGSILLEKNGLNGFGENVIKNSFDRTQDIFLLNGKDTVKLMAYNYERNWGIGNEDSFLLTFSKNDLKSDLEKYDLIIRNIVPELGTVDIKIKRLMKMKKKLKGQVK